jgi:hypothetical protein
MLVQYPGRTLVFVNSIKTARRLDGLLRALGINSRALHAQLQQKQRLNALESFTDLPVGVLGKAYYVVCVGCGRQDTLQQHTASCCDAYVTRVPCVFYSGYGRGSERSGYSQDPERHPLRRGPLPSGTRLCMA